MKFSPIYISRIQSDGNFTAIVQIDDKWEIGATHKIRETAINRVKKGLCLIEQHNLTEDNYEKLCNTFDHSLDLSQMDKYEVVQMDQILDKK